MMVSDWLNWGYKGVANNCKKKDMIFHKTELQYTDSQILIYENFIRNLNTRKSVHYDFILNNRWLSNFDLEEVCRINQELKLFRVIGEMYEISPNAEYVIKKGLKNYLHKCEKEKHIASTHNKIAIIISGLALFVAAIQPIRDIYKDANTTHDNSKRTIELVDSILNNRIRNNVNIKIIADSLRSDSDFIEILTQIIKHDSNDLNVRK